MRKTTYFFTVILTLSAIISCENDPWTTDPDMEHIYYVGFYKTGVFSDALNYEISSDGTARWRINKGTWDVTGNENISSNIPMQFHSERVRSYDAVTFFWVTNADDNSNLTAGSDYIIIDASGKEIELRDGKYSLLWDQTKKGIQNVRIKRLTASTGVLKVNTLDPSKGRPQTSEDKYIESTRNNMTEQYEVRGLSHDFNKVTISLK